MFALIVERPLLQWADFLPTLQTWVQDAGGIAVLIVFILGIVQLCGVRLPGSKQRGVYLLNFVGALVVMVLAVFYVVISVLGMLARPPGFREAVWTAACGLALVILFRPLLRDVLFRFKWRRIWALAILSIKEAKSRGVLWLCLIIPLILLYADWYLPYTLPEKQLQSRVGVVYFALTLLFFSTAILLGSFSIPNDIRNQTIQTIVTKPVERYEIVLGRFLGYALLLFGELVVLSMLSLFYVIRGLTPQAEEESYHARVPAYAEQLKFHGTRDEKVGESVGNEWTYRSYIGGTAIQPRKQYAIWVFPTLPSHLADRSEAVPLEFTFEIFRTTTGDVGKGVYCALVFAPGELSVQEVERRLKKMAEDRDQRPGESSRDLESRLIKDHGMYLADGVEVTEYHTQSLRVPAALFQKLLAARQAGGGKAETSPAMQVLLYVEPTSSTQLVGVARHDIYLLVDDLPFWVNFLKGTVALWLGSCMVLGIAVMASTYLSGVIALLATLTLSVFGLFRDYVQKVAEGEGIGSMGPFEAGFRMVNRKAAVMQLDRSDPWVFLSTLFDNSFRFVLRRVMKVFPDVTSFGLGDYVADGFDIAWGQMLLLNEVLPLVGYLLCWALVGYYLIKWREIAIPT